MTAYLDRSRWFAGKGRGHEVVDVDRVATLPGEGADAPLVTLELLTVQYDDGGDAEVYQMPLVHHRDEQPGLTGSLLGRHEGAWTYDAVHDADAMARFLRLFADTEPGGATPVGGASFHRVEPSEAVGPVLDPALPATVLTGEQSNTSVRFGTEVLLKLFRKVTPGRNPDIEVHDALTRAGTPYVAPLHGWAQAGTGDDLVDLAMLQSFLPGASDGWELALTSAASGQADGFVGDARALGVAVADVHAALREEFGTGTVEGAAVAARMRTRLEAALVGLPDLAASADGLHRVLDALGDLDAQQVQRVHGDLHLGQTLRLQDGGWRLVDFEGEPAKELEERRLPDSPWRDVAGMLRSFDYAARSVVKERALDADVADAWLVRSRAAFLEGYLERRAERSPRSGGATALGPVEQSLVDAYEADKAVYEVGYESRNRPGWVDIPLTAVRRIAADPGGTP